MSSNLRRHRLVSMDTVVDDETETVFEDDTETVPEAPISSSTSTIMEDDMVESDAETVEHREEKPPCPPITSGVVVPAPPAFPPPLVLADAIFPPLAGQENRIPAALDLSTQAKGEETSLSPVAAATAGLVGAGPPAPEKVGFWEKRISSTRGTFYYTHNNHPSVWHADNLPLGWGKGEYTACGSCYVNLFAPNFASTTTLPTHPACYPYGEWRYSAYNTLNSAFPPLISGQMSSTIVQIREAVDAICSSLNNGTYNPPSGCHPGHHYFPAEIHKSHVSDSISQYIKLKWCTYNKMGGIVVWHTDGQKPDEVVYWENKWGKGKKV